MLDGIFKSVFNPMTLLSIATMNPALIAIQLTRQIASQLGQQLIQNLGQSLGLPQSFIDMAQAGFAQSMGDVQGAQQNFNEVLQGFQPADRGNIQRNVDTLEDAMSNLLNMGVENAKESTEGGASSTKKKGSILVQLAIALGQSMDQKMNDMAALTDDIGNLGKIDNSNQSKYGELTGELQGLGQELKLLSDALSNTVKSIGESASKMASKN